MLLFTLCILWAVVGPRALEAADKPDRQVAVTIDDLPAGAANSMSSSTIAEMTRKLLSTLRDQKVPVTLTCKIFSACEDFFMRIRQRPRLVGLSLA